LTWQVERITVSFDNVALTIRNVVDPSVVDLLARTKDTLPTSYWVGTDNRASSKLAFEHSIKQNQVWLTYCWALNSSPLLSGEPRSSSIKSIPCSATTFKNSGWKVVISNCPSLEEIGILLRYSE
jgi:hypothetical protein